MGLPVASLIPHLPSPIFPISTISSAIFQNHSDSCVGSRQPGGWWRRRCSLGGWLGRCGFETSLRLCPQPNARTASRSSRTELSPRSGILSIMGDGPNVIDRVAARVYAIATHGKGRQRLPIPDLNLQQGPIYINSATSFWRS